METLETWPQAGKSVTVVIVNEGVPTVLLGKVLVCKEELLAIKIRNKIESQNDLPVTLMYEYQEFSYQLRGRLTEWLDKDRFLVSLQTKPKRGERREFIRADMTLGVRVDEPVQEACNIESIASWIEGFSNDPDAYKWDIFPIDLSGSGARFPTQKVRAKGQFVAVSFLLPEDNDVRVIHVPASVIRVKPLKDGPTLFELAVEFSNVGEEERDLINFVVFEARARELELTTRPTSQPKTQS